MARTRTLCVGDVLLEIDGADVVGEPIEWSRFLNCAVIKVMRLRGYVPLTAGVLVRPFKCLLSRVNANAVAFEIDLRSVAENSRARAHKKTRYVFICAGQEEATEWLHAVQAIVRAREDDDLGERGHLGDPDFKSRRI